MLLASVSLGILVVYVFGSLNFVDFIYASEASRFEGDSSGEAEWFVGGMSGFMAVLPLAAWLFMGIETLNFSCDQTDKPKSDVPIGSVTCMTTLFVTGTLVLFVTCTQIQPGLSTLVETDFPFNAGFMHMFNISKSSATMLSLPAVFATAFGFAYSYGKLLMSMSYSGLFPPIFQQAKYAHGVPSLVGYLLTVIAYLDPLVFKDLFNFCALVAFFSYSCQLYGFIQSRTVFRNMPRVFRNPLGVPSAILGLLVFSLAIIAVLGFQNDHAVLIAFIVYSCICSFYYYTYAKSHQKFSAEESSILFTTYVIR
jgi:amino acid transporter